MTYLDNYRGNWPVLLCTLLLACTSNPNHRTKVTDSDSDSLDDSDSSSASSDLTCEMIAQSNVEYRTTAGCEFYPVSLQNMLNDINSPYYGPAFAIVAANHSATQSVNASLYIADPNQGWLELDQVEIPPLSLHRFEPSVQAQLQMNESGLIESYPYKLQSDRPIVAYQFSSTETNFSTDASTLIPVSSLSSNYHVVGSKQENHELTTVYPAYFVVAAVKDDTNITIDVTNTSATQDTPAQHRETIEVSLHAGDIYIVQTESGGDNLTGSTVVSDPEHPVAVFYGHYCTNIPNEEIYACDHLEEQLPGLDFWGSQFVAPHLPSRFWLTGNSASMWHIYAPEDNTTVEIIAPDSVEGIPFETKTFQKGELVEFVTETNDDAPGDFLIRSLPVEVDGQLVEKPIAVFQYLVGASYFSESDNTGDPAMVYLSPMRQYLSKYVMLVPEGWRSDRVIITRPANATIFFDGEPIPDEEFVDLPESDHQVARLLAPDGVHTFESENGARFGVTVVGWDDFDSYAYVGGMGMSRSPL